MSRMHFSLEIVILSRLIFWYLDECRYHFDRVLHLVAFCLMKCDDFLRQCSATRLLSIWALSYFYLRSPICF